MAFTLIGTAIGGVGNNVNLDSSGAIAATTTSFSDTSLAGFTSANVAAYPNIGVVGAGAAGANLNTTITFVSATTVTTAVAAGTTVTAAEWAWGVIGSGGAIDTNGTTTLRYVYPNAVHPGDLLFVPFNVDSTLTASVTDSQSNTWHAAITGPTAGDFFQQGYYLFATKSASAGSLSITVTTSATFVGTSTGISDVAIYHFTPPSGYSVTFIGAHQATTATGTSVSSGNVTVPSTVNYSVLVGIAGVDSHIVGPVQSGWTQLVGPSGNAAQYIAQSATGTFAATFTQASSGGSIAMIAAFGAVPSTNAPYYSAD